MAYLQGQPFAARPDGDDAPPPKESPVVHAEVVASRSARSVGFVVVLTVVVVVVGGGGGGGGGDVVNLMKIDAIDRARGVHALSLLGAFVFSCLVARLFFVNQITRDAFAD